MRFSFVDVLEEWFPIRHQHNWALGAVIDTEGSVYRKTGALMLFSDAGHQLGLLSGGCLESDLLVQARKVIALEQSKHITYDATDEENVAWRLGIGCGGRADILLHPCQQANDYLQLEAVYEALQQGRALRYTLATDEIKASIVHSPKQFTKRVPGERDQSHLHLVINPAPRLVIFGGGADIESIAHLACQLGWVVCIVSQRIKHVFRASFPESVQFFSTFDDVDNHLGLSSIDAAIIANHNVERDAEALSALSDVDVPYVGLLGPKHRKEDVIKAAMLTREMNIAGPMGLALGGDLPENIALSVLAECHAVLFGSDAKPLSDAYL